MKFKLYCKTDHNINQKNSFIEKYKFDENFKLNLITDTLFITINIINFKYTIDKYFTITINVSFEEYGIEQETLENKNQIIKQFFNDIKIISI